MLHNSLNNAQYMLMLQVNLRLKLLKNIKLKDLILSLTVIFWIDCDYIR